MRYILIVTLLMFSAMAQALPILSLSPSRTVLGFNDNFFVDVFVSGIEVTDELLAFGFDVGTDSGLVYNSASVAPPFFDDSGFFATTDVAGSAFPAVSGDSILLATLNLTTGTTAGFLNVSIFSTMADYGISEGLFTHSTTYSIDESSTVEVAGDFAVPLPSTILLIGMGLLGMVMRIRSW